MAKPTRTMASGQPKKKMLLVSTKQEIRKKNCTLLLYHIELWTNLIWNCFLNHSSAWRCSGVTVWFAFDQERQHFALSIPNNTFDVFHSAFPLPLCCGSSALHRMQQNVLDAESPLKMYRNFQCRKCSTGYKVHRTKQCYKGTTCAPADIRNGL